ncbi:hypothetical protein [Streptomyces sp. NRRL F-2664]|uniref:hypothetical protein n=1 Tax=Streptomyces sp. NRRL F-2664 TaxID=1463842 RepID=UPI0004CAFB62|nr:hypothetical protein [Streptomyces sp. NRRL F-2664]
MDDQGGAGGVPLHHDDDEARRRAPHATPHGGKRREDDGTTRAADTDEASRLDRPAESDGADSGADWTGPDDERPSALRRSQ